MGLCGERGVTLSFLTENGRFLARVQGPVSGNVLLRREQYRRADDPEKSLSIAKSIVIGKIVNSRTALLRGARENQGEGTGTLSLAAARLAEILCNIETTADLDTLRGIEGDAARAYFSTFDDFICAQKEEFYFRERSRRPPLDSMNALLSFFYTLLVHDTASALESVGLDPAVGYLHSARPGRPSLALDIMEEFRPFIADRLALSLVNRRQVKGNGFKKTESGAVLMDDETRKEVLVAYQKRKQEEITHPFIGEKIPVGLIPYVQSLLLSRHLRGDLDAYPPFRWK
jgi:CRISPR-associated protein Cas1